jgi:hypothetical protein
MYGVSLPLMGSAMRTSLTVSIVAKLHGMHPSSGDVEWGTGA